MLRNFPTLSRIVELFDTFLERNYGDFFGPDPKHPFRAIKPFKVIHDNLWGTNPFSWRELALIDSPLLQRLRGIHQTGLAHHVYPSAHHTRFEHSLGVATVASRAFDALIQRHADDFLAIAKMLGRADVAEVQTNLREELRLAAILHDVGHSIHSHTSEQVYQQLPLMKRAVAELRKFVGRKKGAGEVISFCFSRTKGIQRLLDHAYTKLGPEDQRRAKPIDFDNVSLMIVGRSKHPCLAIHG